MRKKFIRINSMKNFTAAAWTDAGTVIHTIKHWYTALGLMGIQGSISMIFMTLAMDVSKRNVFMEAGRQTAVGKLPGLLLTFIRTVQ